MKEYRYGAIKITTITREADRWAIVPGSFDPVTWGQRISSAAPPARLTGDRAGDGQRSKTGLYMPEERLYMLGRACGAFSGWKPIFYGGMTHDYIARHG